jgi:hypothetical protein
MGNPQMPGFDGLLWLIAALITSCCVVTAVTGDLVVWFTTGAAILVSLWVAQSINK